MNKLARHFPNDIHAHISCLNPAKGLAKRCELPLPLPLPPKSPIGSARITKVALQAFSLTPAKAQTTVAYYYFIVFLTIVCSICFYA